MTGISLSSQAYTGFLIFVAPDVFFMCVNCLERLGKQCKGKIFFRANIVLLNDAGNSAPEIAKALGISHPTVLSWLKKYEADSIDGLKDKEHEVGKPATLVNKTLDALKEFMDKSPLDFGYLQTCWTIFLMLYHLQTEYSINSSRTTVKRQLKKQGLIKRKQFL